MLPRQEYCSCVNGYPMHDVVDTNGETMTLKCRKCGKKHTTATPMYLKSLEQDD